MIRTDKAHPRLLVLGYAGSERTTHRGRADQAGVQQRAEPARGELRAPVRPGVRVRWWPVVISPRDQAPSQATGPLSARGGQCGLPYSKARWRREASGPGVSREDGGVWLADQSLHLLARPQVSMDEVVPARIQDPQHQDVSVGKCGGRGLPVGSARHECRPVKPEGRHELSVCMNRPCHIGTGVKVSRRDTRCARSRSGPPRLNRRRRPNWRIPCREGLAGLPAARRTQVGRRGPGLEKGKVGGALSQPPWIRTYQGHEVTARPRPAAEAREPDTCELQLV